MLRGSSLLHWLTQFPFKYSKHPHIRTLILEVRLIRFLYIGCLVKNQPEGVLKLFLKIGGGNQNCNKVYSCQYCTQDAMYSNLHAKGLYAFIFECLLLYCFAFLTRTKHMNATYFQHNSVSLTTAAART